MEKFYYNSKDIMEITGYKESKAKNIIRELNLRLAERYKEQDKEILLIKNGVPIWFFKEMMGIERND